MNSPRTMKKAGDVVEVLFADGYKTKLLVCNRMVEIGEGSYVDDGYQLVNLDTMTVTRIEGSISDIKKGLEDVGAEVITLTGE